MSFDICVANPPYSLKPWAYDIFNSNKYGRTTGYSIPKEGNADYAFVLHMIKSMNEKGKAGIVLPLGVLFRAVLNEKFVSKLSEMISLNQSSLCHPTFSMALQFRRL